METFYVLKSGLILHLAGIVMMVGLTVASLSAYQQFWKFVAKEKDRALPIYRTISRFFPLQIIGGVLIIAGGITMMMAMHGAAMQQQWFRIKLVVIGLIILNPIIIARTANRKLRRLLADHETGRAVELSIPSAVRRRIMLFHLLQLFFFLVIFMLSAYRFN